MGKNDITVSMRDLFESQKRSVNHFFDSVDLQDVERVADLLLACKGTVILSGVGKSGLIAQKIAATFVSTGTRSIFLSPTDALHGDIGIVNSEDVFIAFSKGGGSEELVQLIPYVHKKGAKSIAVVSSTGSRLEKLCSQTVYLPVLRELCPHDLAPTTSTAIQLLFGDILAVALMRKRAFSIADFASNHPGGILGKKITLRVADLMFKGDSLPLCKPSDKLIDMLHDFSAKKCGCLLVVDSDQELLGIFTDGDLRRCIQMKGPGALEGTLAELMTKSPKSISHHQMAIDAVRSMEEDPSKLITVLPVLDGKKLVGLVRMHDIIQLGLNS